MMPRIYCLSLIAALLIFCFSVKLSSVTPHADSSLSQQKTHGNAKQFATKILDTARSRFKLPPIFNFDRFKSIFKRKYRSIVEELSRKRLFLARALRAFGSAVSYKHSYISSYLAINDMSDWTPDEVKAMYTNSHETLKKLGLDGYEVGSRNKAIQEDGSKIERDTIPVVEHPERPGFKEIIEEMEAEQGGEKNDEADDKRHLSMNNLLRELAKRVVSNNPDPSVENSGGLMSFIPSGFAQKIIESSGATYVANVIKSTSLNFMSTSQVASEAQNHLRSVNQEPDEVFIDHRIANCFSEIKSQGQCASCYAFATMSLYEWTFCKITGVKVGFSEQYIVDCGKTVGLNGCTGGIHSLVTDFVVKFGLELRENYPYVERENECPYDAEYVTKSPESMGYIRVKGPTFWHAPIEIVDEILAERPLIINVAVDDKFAEYGGGVDDLIECNTENMHAMLLIGSGREDGKEYWLVRNSYRISWGESGHYKLSKKSDCLVPKLASFLEANFEPDYFKNLNDKYDKQKIANRHKNNMNTKPDFKERTTKEQEQTSPIKLLPRDSN